MKTYVLPACFLAIAAYAHADPSPSRSAFLQVDAFQDLFVDVTSGGLVYTLTVGADPEMVYQGVSYQITDVFGFWVLSNDDDLTAVHTDIGVWMAVANQAGDGGTAGWETTPPEGLTPGESFTYTFDSLNVESVEQVGFAVRLDGLFPGTAGNTGHATVPEPSSLLALLYAGPLALLRRRTR